MTNKGLGDLLHLAKLAMGRGKATAAPGWYSRGRSIYESGPDGENRVASVRGPKTRSQKDDLAALAESRAAFIAALDPMAAKELVEEVLRLRSQAAESGPRELTNLFHVARDGRESLDNELAHTLDCGHCGHCGVCEALRWNRPQGTD